LNSVNQFNRFLFLAGTLGQGGAEKQLYLMASTLKKNKHEVYIITFGSNEYWEKYLIDCGINLIYCKSKSRLFRLLFLLKSCFIVSPNVFYSIHFYTSGYVGLIGKIFKSTITIGSIRSDGFSEILSNGFWSKFHMSLPTLIISNNNHGSNAIHKKLNIDKAKLNILDNSVFDFGSRANENHSSILKIIFVGRMSQEKDPIGFLQICKLLLDKGINFRADMFGDGKLNSEVSRIIFDFGLNNNVFFLGSKPSVASYFHNYNILISTSLHEGTANVLLESFSANLVPFSRINSASCELYQKHVGLNNFLFDSVNQAYELILKYLHTPDYYNRITAQFGNFIRFSYSTELQYKRLIDILEKYNI
jgi:glycosyltransferase involved in cell wall biosynthesis